MKPPYILKTTYPIATVMMKIHSLAVAMRAPRSMALAVCDNMAPWRYVETIAISNAADEE
jgi:hypothetical protein